MTTFPHPLSYASTGGGINSVDILNQEKLDNQLKELKLPAQEKDRVDPWKAIPSTYFDDILSTQLTWLDADVSSSTQSVPSALLNQGIHLEAQLLHIEKEYLKREVPDKTALMLIQWYHQLFHSTASAQTQTLQRYPSTYSQIALNDSLPSQGYNLSISYTSAGKTCILASKNILLHLFSQFIYLFHTW